MNQFKADLHIHTLLSPCGDLEMSPANIVNRALELDIRILGITDHNSTKHTELIKKLAEKKGIFTLYGAEVTTREEVHCLTFFETPETTRQFQEYIDEFLPNIKNNPEYFGYQAVIDENEMIIEFVEKLLIIGINQTIEQVEKRVHDVGGLFIPAHIDRPKFSLTSQLGFVPFGLRADAFEISHQGDKRDILNKFPYLDGKTFIRSSDAHQLEQIGKGYAIFEIESICWQEILLAIRSQQGRRVLIADKV